MSTARTATTVVTYSLERLFVDQDQDWVTDTIAPVLAWVPGKSKKKGQQPFRFVVDHLADGVAAVVAIDLSWDLGRLAQLVPGVQAHADRLRAKRTAQREHLTELAAYGLTFVAISALMPGRRVVHMLTNVAPDILFDVTPNALRGVETAGRQRGGAAALAEIRAAKGPVLRARADIAEVHLSLWCGSPRIAIMEQLKP